MSGGLLRAVRAGWTWGGGRKGRGRPRGEHAGVVAVYGDRLHLQKGVGKKGACGCESG